MSNLKKCPGQSDKHVSCLWQKYKVCLILRRSPDSEKTWDKFSKCSENTQMGMMALRANGYFTSYKLSFRWVLSKKKEPTSSLNFKNVFYAILGDSPCFCFFLRERSQQQIWVWEFNPVFFHQFTDSWRCIHSPGGFSGVTSWLATLWKISFSPSYISKYTLIFGAAAAKSEQEGGCTWQCSCHTGTNCCVVGRRGFQGLLHTLVNGKCVVSSMTSCSEKSQVGPAPCHMCLDDTSVCYIFTCMQKCFMHTQ